MVCLLALDRADRAYAEPMVADASPIEVELVGGAFDRRDYAVKSRR